MNELDVGARARARVFFSNYNAQRASEKFCWQTTALLEQADLFKPLSNHDHDDDQQQVTD